MASPVETSHERSQHNLNESEGAGETSTTRSPSPRHRSESRSPPRDPSPPQSGENRLRPAGDIINRINWDSKFDRDNYIIGFVDRFEGQLEVSMNSWKKETTDEEFIPQHRVLYIRHKDGEVVWDRRRRIDKIFYSGNSAFSELAFLTRENGAEGRWWLK